VLNVSTYRNRAIAAFALAAAWPAVRLNRAASHARAHRYQRDVAGVKNPLRGQGPDARPVSGHDPSASSAPLITTRGRRWRTSSRGSLCTRAVWAVPVMQGLAAPEATSYA